MNLASDGIQLTLGAGLTPLRKRDEEIGEYRKAARQANASHLIVVDDNGTITATEHVYGGDSSLGNTCPVAQQQLTQVMLKHPGTHAWIEWL